MTRLFSLFFFLFFVKIAAAQTDPNLANQYFTNGEYEKSATLYQQLWEKDDRNEFYFGRYIESLTNLERWEDGDKAIKKQLKKTPDNPTVYVTAGTLSERQGREAEAKIYFEKAVERVQPDFNAVNRLANSFINLAKYEDAIATYERGSKLLNDQKRFAFNLGELYRRKGESPKMIEYYLNAIDDDPAKMMTLKTIFQRYLSEKEYETLQAELYSRIQADDSNPDFTDLLSWTFIQKKDYKNALLQLKALDRKLGENGTRVYQLAETAQADRDYDAAIAAYEYVVAEKGKTSTFYLDSKRESMNCRRKKITEGFAYTTEDLRILEREYNTFLAEFGRNRQTATIIQQLADLEAFWIGDLERAIGLLDTLIATPTIDRNTQARSKISLADFYLMKAEIWESTLLYSQVDKDFREEILGQEARFKNAKLSYFNGDFEWSQAQFDILKASTSRLISNDALDLSVFILENKDMDTTGRALGLYAQAELFIFQNKFEDAFKKLDSLRREFPEHTLQDDLTYLEGQIYFKKRDWNRAAELFQTVADKFPTDIRADNALYALAELNENQLKNPEKAKTIYEKIYTDYSSSVFAVDARKRFRILRGDKMQ
jgi:tetratricopeptide (TPR) repeat protein